MAAAPITLAEFHPNTMTRQVFERQRSSIEKRWADKIAALGCTVQYIDDESNLHDGVALEIDMN